MTPRELHLVLSAARVDSAELRELIGRLESIARRYPIKWWTDRDIPVGLEWDPAIQAEIRQSDLVVALITPAYVNSHYCMERELAPALAKHKRNAGSLVPILVHETAGWQRMPVAKLQAIPTPLLPITNPHWKTPIEYWDQVERDLVRTIEHRLLTPRIVRRRAILAGGAAAIAIAAVGLLPERVPAPEPRAYPRVVAVNRIHDTTKLSWWMEGTKLVVMAEGIERSALQVAVTQEYEEAKRRLKPFTLVRRGDHYEAELTWEGNAYERIGGEHTVAVVLPEIASKTCNLAWRTLALGRDAFLKAKEDWLKVVAFDDRGSATMMRTLVPQVLEANPVAVVGSYHSSVTSVLIRECTARTEDAWQSSRCGPILTLSSAESLRPRPGAQSGPIFLLTASNKTRAEALVHMIEHDKRGEIDPATQSPEFWLIYEDDSQSGSDVSYAIDQKEEIQKALRQSKQLSQVAVRSVSFRHEAGPGSKIDVTAQSQWLTAATLPSLGAVRTFDQLVAALFSNSEVPKVIMFVALDNDIVDFGRALAPMMQPANASAAIRVYIPAPSEVFEQDWSDCFRRHYWQDLVGWRVVTPYDPDQSDLSSEFNQHWAEVAKDTRFSTRGARVYDALQIVQDAIAKVDGSLSDCVEVDRGWFRTLVSDNIAKTVHQGPSGRLAFNEQDTPPRHMEMQPCGLLPLGFKCNSISDKGDAPAAPSVAPTR